VFVPGKPFQPSLMFMGKARRLLKSGTPERCPQFIIINTIIEYSIIKRIIHNSNLYFDLWENRLAVRYKPD
jgi:hypothetical protein